MSYFDDASLVMIPSGYKTSKVYSVKPTSGDGDLTFTRSNDTATRVGPDGLIEKVRTNLALQSNTFSTTWTPSNATVTSGQSGYDGSSDAWLLTKNAAYGSIYQTGISVSNSSVYTFSAYMKANASGSGSLRFWTNNVGADFRVVFNLSTGAIATASANNGTRIDATATDVGGGWWRVSVTGLTGQTSATLNIYAGDTADASGSIYIQDAQLEQGDIATDYIATTTAAVSVGPVANVPRLDYLNSSCPRLLLEPQRTNLALYSENFDNAGWTKLNSTVSANQTQDPSGYDGADKLVQTSATAEHSIYNTITVASGTTYTASVFLKIGDGSTSWPYAQVRFRNGGFGTGGGVVADLLNGTISYSSGLTSSSIQSYGNGWYRISITQAASVNSASAGVVVAFNDTSNSFSVVFAGDTNANMFLFGATIEAGAYATSYIPTLGAAVTRGADAASKTGISSLIGQTEGTLFAEVDITEFKGGRTEDIVLSAYSNSSNRIMISFDGIGTKTIYVFIRSSATSYDISQPKAFQLGVNKIALSYGNNYRALYLNGEKIYESTATFPVPSIPNIAIGSRDDLTGQFGDGVSQVLVFPTRLSDADAIALTA